MRKNLLSLALFLVMGGVNSVNAKITDGVWGTPAENGTWDAETNVYSWTLGYSNLCTIFETPGGMLADYTAIHLTTSNYTDIYRICFMNGGTRLAEIAFYSAGQKDIVFADRAELQAIDLSQVTHISFGGASGSGSINVTNVFLEAPTRVTFNESGVCSFDFSEVTCTGSVSFDKNTGIVTSTGTNGHLMINFDKAYDLSALTRWQIEKTGDDVFGGGWALKGITKKSDGSNLGMYSGHTDRRFGAGQTVNPNDYDMTAVTGIDIPVTKEGTMTISELKLTANVITASDPRLVDVTTLPYKQWSSAGADAEVVGAAYPDNKLGTAMGQGSTIFGDGNVGYLNYVDLTGYTSLKVKASAGAQVRICMNRVSDGGTVSVDQTKPVDSEGYATFDLTGYAFSHLHCVKFPWNGQTHTVYSIEATNPNAEVSYIISGSGLMTSSVDAALADASATIIDATGVTGTGIDLVTANPNCIIKANAGVLSNANNVMVGTTIANLSLSDNYPFAVPAGASADNATYTRTLSSTYGTICLPYAVASDANVHYYTLGANDGETLVIEEATNVAAGTPAIFKKLGADAMTFTGSGALAAAHDGTASTGTVMTMKGTYTQKVVTDAAELENLYYVSGDQIMQANFSLTINPFRAYMEASSSAPARIRLTEADVTAINAVFNAENSDVKVVAIYGANGAQQNDLQKGVNIVKLSNNTVKKIIVK